MNKPIKHKNTNDILLKHCNCSWH